MIKKRTLLTKISILTATFLFLSSICYSSVSYASAKNEDNLEKYISKLNELNLELGTTYAIPDKETHESSGSDYESLIDFYTSMTVEEFEVYIRNVNDNISNLSINNKQEELILQKESSSIYAALPYRVQTQKFLFSNSNYFYMKAKVYTGEGIRYSSISEFGDSISVYPAYRYQNATYSYNSGCTSVFVTFTAGYYAAPNLLYTVTPKEFYATFKAVGGDVEHYAEV